MLLLSNCLFL